MFGGLDPISLGVEALVIGGLWVEDPTLGVWEVLTEVNSGVLLGVREPKGVILELVRGVEDGAREEGITLGVVIGEGMEILLPVMVVTVVFSGVVDTSLPVFCIIERETVEELGVKMGEEEELEL